MLRWAYEIAHVAQAFVDCFLLVRSTGNLSRNLLLIQRRIQEFLIGGPNFDSENIVDVFFAANYFSPHLPLPVAVARYNPDLMSVSLAPHRVR